MTSVIVTSGGGDGVTDGVGELLGVALGVALLLGVADGVGLLLGVADAVLVVDGVVDGVGVLLAVEVVDGVGVALAVEVVEGVAVLLAVEVVEGVAVGLLDTLGVGELLGLLLGEGVGDANTEPPALAAASSTPTRTGVSGSTPTAISWSGSMVRSAAWMDPEAESKDSATSLAPSAPSTASTITRTRMARPRRRCCCRPRLSPPEGAAAAVSLESVTSTLSTRTEPGSTASLAATAAETLRRSSQDGRPERPSTENAALAYPENRVASIGSKGGHAMPSEATTESRSFVVCCDWSAVSMVAPLDASSSESCPREAPRNATRAARITMINTIGTSVRPQHRVLQPCRVPRNLLEGPCASLGLSGSAPEGFRDSLLIEFGANMFTGLDEEPAQPRKQRCRAFYMRQAWTQASNNPSSSKRTYLGLLAGSDC